MNCRVCLARITQGFPSGQRGRTQDPLSSTSQVRILPPAPIEILNFQLENSIEISSKFNSQIQTLNSQIQTQNPNRSEYE